LNFNLDLPKLLEIYPQYSEALTDIDPFSH
jgi:hypothetical protein